MKKLILTVTILAVACATTFVACKKDSVGGSAPTTKQQAKPNSLAKNYTSVLKLFNATITISWKDGCYSATTWYYPNGTIQCQKINCTPGCNFCMVTGTATVLGLVTGGTSPNDPFGLAVQYSADPTNYYGMVAKNTNDNTLIFAIDKTKISNEIYQAKFAGNTIDLSSGFAIDENTFQVLGIDRAHQFIPAGNYPLYREGNLVFFEYSLN